MGFFNCNTIKKSHGKKIRKFNKNSIIYSTVIFLNFLYNFNKFDCGPVAQPGRAAEGLA
jgi:hypothetical protein